MYSKISFCGGLAAVLALTLSACTYAPPGPSPSLNTAPAPTDSVDSTMVSFMEQGAVAVIAEVRWPGGSWAKAYGVRDLEGKQPVEQDDRVAVASVTKSMTAVSVLKLVDDGLLGLDDPVNGLVEAFTTVLKPPGPISARQLLNHTSGMPTFQQATLKSVDDVAANIREDISPQQGLEITGTLPWEARDVGNFGYSDSNYLALGQLLEKVRGKPYTQIFQDDIVTPLELSKTSIDDAGFEMDMVHGYITLRGERVDLALTPLQPGSPAYGAISTMSDVNDFFAALFRGELVSQRSIDEMTKTDAFPLYGLGLWKYSRGCDSDHRYGGKGGFWTYRTTAMSSTDGKYQASMTLVPPPIPTDVEDPESENKLHLWDSQMESALQETLDRLCPGRP